MTFPRFRAIMGGADGESAKKGVCDMEIVKVRTYDEIDDAQVMAEWWNDCFARARDIRVKETLDDGTIVVSVLGGRNAEGRDETRLSRADEWSETRIALADLAKIDGVLAVEYAGKGNFRTTFAETDCSEDGAH